MTPDADDPGLVAHATTVVAVKEPLDRAQLAAVMAEQLQVILSAVERGEMDASAAMRGRLEGATLVLRALAEPDPVAAFAAMLECD